MARFDNKVVLVSGGARGQAGGRAGIGHRRGTQDRYFIAFILLLPWR